MPLQLKSRVAFATLVCFVAGVVFVSLANVDVPDPAAIQVWGQLSPSRQISSISQSFVASENNLSRLDLRLSTAVSPDNTPVQTNIALREGALDYSGPFNHVAVKGEPAGRGTLALKFQPLARSRNQPYTVSIQRTTSTGRLLPVLLSFDNWYSGGSLAVDGLQQQGDLSLRAYYRERMAGILWAGVQRAVQQLRLFVLLAITLLLPGFVLSHLLRRRAPWPSVKDPWIGVWQHLALYVALSLSLLTLLHAVAEMLGTPLRPRAVGVSLVTLLIVAVVMAGQSFRRRRQLRLDTPPTKPAAKHASSRRSADSRKRRPKTVQANRPGAYVAPQSVFGVTSVAVFAVIFLLRLGQVHAVGYPSWIDSVEHAQRVDAILSTGRTLPEFYHYAFHFLVADLAALSGSSIADTMLLVGQVLSALVPIAVFSLAAFLLGNPWPALVSAVVAGFATTMPSYYVSWGRYPFLLAWVIFPVAAVLIIYALSARAPVWASAALASVTVGGLLLTHSRMGAYLLLLEGILLLQRLVQRLGWRDLLQWFGRALLINGPPLVLLALWTLYFMDRSAESMAIPDHASLRCLDPIGLLRRVAEATRGAPELVLYAVGLAGLLGAILRRNRAAWITGAWFALAIAWPALPPGMPGCALITNDVLAISLFLPVALGWGFGIQTAWSLLPDSTSRSVRSASLATVVVVCTAIVLLGSLNMLTLLNPDTLLVRAADETAMLWAKANLPPDTVFLVNSARWFRHRFHVSDGGAWIPFVTQQHVDYDQSFRVGEELEEKRLALKDLCTALADTDVSHIFLGQRGGLITGQALEANSSCFRQVYDQSGVSIFEVRRNTSAAP